MALDGIGGLAAGAVGLGLVHGVEPGHGWPVAATYALDRANKWLAGLLAGLVIGVGHLVSSVAMVVVFFWAKSYFELTELGWMNVVAGVLLILLGLREVRHYQQGGHHHGHGHSHGHEHGHDHGDGHDHSHGHDDHEHGHGHDHVDGHGHDDGHHTHDHHAHVDHAGDPGDDGGLVARLRATLPLGGGHSHPDPDAADERGLAGIAAFAFALGFAHEEEFEIIAICLGTEYCLELMLVYALTVIAGIVALTLLLVAGYEHYEQRVEAYTPYLPLFSAAVLVLMGLAFVFGLF